MIVSIEPGCIGCGLCAATCPAVFAMDAEGQARVTAQPADADEAAAREAAENCPAGVIRAD
ncbi:MAG TPA: ferredoxin [Candidatus Fournierella merdigallinarum]|nr:ferredoxin [Candidatus Fournierella merdigallinarum]